MWLRAARQAFFGVSFLFFMVISPQSANRIDATNWPHLGQRRVEINWPGIGAVDIATAKRFVADLQAAIDVAERFAERNDRQRLFNQLNRNA